MLMMKMIIWSFLGSRSPFYKICGIFQGTVAAHRNGRHQDAEDIRDQRVWLDCSNATCLLYDGPFSQWWYVALSKLVSGIQRNVLHSIAWYCMELSCVDTIVVIMSDWRDTSAGPSENLKWPRPGIHIYIDWWQVCTILHKGLNIWILLYSDIFAME